MLLQVLVGLQLATDLQLDRLRAHALQGAARQLISSHSTDADDGILDAARIPEGNTRLVLGALAAAVQQAPEAARQQVLAGVPAVSKLESWLRLRKHAGSEFVWELEGFSALPVEGRLESPSFSCGGYDWRLLCFPKGYPEDREAEGYFSLYLLLAPGSQHPGGWQQAYMRKRWVQGRRSHAPSPGLKTPPPFFICSCPSTFLPRLLQAPLWLPASLCSTSAAPPTLCPNSFLSYN